MQVEFDGTVHRWAANPRFFLVQLPSDISSDIRDLFEGLTNGFGSLKVEAVLGHTVWRTSIFPNARSGTYDLPLKAEVRRPNDVRDGSVVHVELEILGL
jgi:hypothetical protein